MKPLRILIVDDDADFADTLADVFEARGHRTEIARSGEEAIGKYEASERRALERDSAASGPMEQYQAAVADAASADPDEIYKSLSPVVPFNNRLVWSVDDGTTRVLTVTWTSWSGYNEAVGATTILAREVWATLVPDIREFALALPGTPDDKPLRIEQLLGLPPGTGKAWFVEMWASPDDLFRPSADPEITDFEAGPDFPKPASRLAVSPEHAAWIDSLKASSYGAAGYPWTRLGYTYDWGNPSSEIGLSEYVIAAGATVRIHASIATKFYLNAPHSTAGDWAFYR